MERELDTASPEARYALAAIASGLAVWDWDIRAGVVWRSAGFFTVFGHGEAARSTSLDWWVQRVHPEDRERVVASLVDASRNQADGKHPDSWRQEYRFLRGDGRWSRVVDCVRIVRGAEGRPIRMVGALQDVTAQRDAEQALRASEQRYRLAALATQDVIYDWDLRSETVVWASPVVFGYTGDELEPTLAWWTARLHPEDRDRVLAGLDTAIRSGASHWGDSYRFRRKDGTWADVVDRGLVDFDGSGRPRRMLGAMQDVTDRRRAEAQVRALNAALEQRVAERTAELVAANDELEAFSYSVSHDLRAPLRAIEGFSGLIGERYGDALGEPGREWLDRVRASSQRMSELIDALLDLARVARAPLSLKDVDLGAIAEDIVQELRRRHPQRNVTFTAAPAPARGDPALLRVVLENLLENAWKFTRETSSPSVRFGVVRADDGDVRYYVRDNGVGFDPAYAEKLFTPFQRLHEAGRFEGTGVGLATVRRIVQRHGGRVWAESREGAGATIWFVLPSPPG
jgi:PAS domain S-box-containing protein